MRRRGSRTALKQIIPDAMALAFNKNSCCGVWWYEVKTGNLAYGKKIMSHRDPMFSILDCWGTNKCVRGMVFVKNNKYYVIVYAEDPVLKDIVDFKSCITDIVIKISNKTSFSISDVVNEEGYRLA